MKEVESLEWVVEMKGWRHQTGEASENRWPTEH
jgi:hypothetical protein